MNELPMVKFLQIAAPVADAFAGTKTYPPVAISNYQDALFLVNLGVNTGGTGRTKIYAFAHPFLVRGNPNTGRVAVGYWARIGTGQNPDTEGTWTYYAAGAEFTPTAANSATTQWLIRITNIDAQVACPTCRGVGLELVEAVDDPIVGSVTAILSPVYSKPALFNGFLSGVGSAV